MDLKLADPVAHRAWTGVDNASILENLAILAASGRRFVTRVPLIPGVNDSEAAMEATARLLAPAGDRVSVELLPYNRLAGAKYAMLGRRYEPGFDESRSPEERITAFSREGLACRVLRG